MHAFVVVWTRAALGPPARYPLRRLKVPRRYHTWRNTPPSHAVFRGSLGPLVGLLRYTEFTVYKETEGGVYRADRGLKPRVKVVRGGIDAPERPWPPGELGAAGRGYPVCQRFQEATNLTWNDRPVALWQCCSSSPPLPLPSLSPSLSPPAHFSRGTNAVLQARESQNKHRAYRGNRVCLLEGGGTAQEGLTKCQKYKLAFGNKCMIFSRGDDPRVGIRRQRCGAVGSAIGS